MMFGYNMQQELHVLFRNLKKMEERKKTQTEHTSPHLEPQKLKGTLKTSKESCGTPQEFVCFSLSHIFETEKSYFLGLSRRWSKIE